MAIFHQPKRSNGNGFKNAMQYVMTPKPEKGERVGFAYVRNMGTMTTNDSPEALAARMRLNVESHRNNGHRSNKPLKHFVIAFSPEDTSRLTPEILQEYADKHLEALGLSEHQAVIAEHIDTDHRHLHLIINKVHPVTGKLWNDSHAVRTAAPVTTELDAKHGLTAPATRAFSQEAEHRTAYDKGADEYALRNDEPRPMKDAAAKEVRTLAADDFREAETWGDLAERLEAKGLALTPHSYRGKQGLRVIDTEAGTYVAVSKLGKDIRMDGLEARLGRFEDYQQQLDAPTVEQAQERAAEATQATLTPQQRIDTLQQAIAERQAYSLQELEHTRTQRSYQEAKEEESDLLKIAPEIAKLADDAERETLAELDGLLKPNEAAAYFASFKQAIASYRRTASAAKPDFAASDAAALDHFKGRLQRKKRAKLQKVLKARDAWLAAVEKQKEHAAATAWNKQRRADLHHKSTAQSLKLNPHRRDQLKRRQEAAGLVVSFADIKGSGLPQEQQDTLRRTIVQDDYNRRTEPKRVGTDWARKADLDTAERLDAARLDYMAYLEAGLLTSDEVSFEEYKELAHATAQANGQHFAQSRTRSRGQSRSR